MSMNPAQIQTAVVAALVAAFPTKHVYSWTGKNLHDIETALDTYKMAIIVEKPTFGTNVTQAQGCAAFDFNFCVIIAANPEGTEDVDAHLFTAIAAVKAIKDTTNRDRKEFGLDTDQPFNVIVPGDGKTGWVINFTKQTAI